MVLGAGVDLVGNLARMRDAIADAAIKVGRNPEDVTLVGVSKTQPAEAVAELIRAGLRHIGENRVQEAADKFPILRELLAGEAVPIGHMIGHLQSNKAANAVALFDRVDSVDSLHVAEALSRRCPPGQQLPVLLEVYVGDDPRRPGLRPEQLVEVAGQIIELPRLRVEGLMTIAPLGGDSRTAFQQVGQMKQRLSEAYPRIYFGVLSMGMSEDFSVAIEEGSTEVRVGTALFGPRQSR
jgi:pyridoxal phosphate enzyme (YggS family)